MKPPAHRPSAQVSTCVDTKRRGLPPPLSNPAEACSGGGKPPVFWSMHREERCSLQDKGSRTEHATAHQHPHVPFPGGCRRTKSSTAVSRPHALVNDARCVLVVERRMACRILPLTSE